MHTHTQAFAQRLSQTRLLWLKIRGGIINHKRLPLVKSSLSWCEQSAMPAEQRQALAGWRAWGACRGFSLHPEAYQSHGLGLGCGFERPTETQLPLVTDSSVVQSILQRNEKQLEGWRAHCSNLHLFSTNSSSEGSWLFASTSRMAKLWVLDDESDLGLSWKLRKMFPVRSSETESCTLTLK